MKAKNLIWKLVLITALLIGIIGAFNQFSVGHVVTGISKQVPWGMYIAAFTFFIGISTGTTIVGFIIHIFNIEWLKPLEFKAVIISIASLCGALLFLTMDVGSPFKMLGVPLIWRNLSSVFFYSSLSYMTFGALLIYQLLLLMKKSKNTANEKDINRIKWLSIISLPFAMGIVLVPDGALFSFVKAREFWNNPLLLPHFANAALASGVAVLVLTTAISHFILNKQILQDNALKFIRYLMLFLVAGLLFLDFFDILVLNNSNRVASSAAWDLIIGRHLLLFLVNIGGLLIASIVLMSRYGSSLKGLLISSVLVILAISAYRYDLVIVGQEVPLINGEIVGAYSVTLTEIAVATGITSFCLIIYQTLINKIDTQPVST